MAEPILDIDDAISKVQNDLNIALALFDRWLSQNPSLAHPGNADLKAQKQNIKRLRLRLDELRDMKKKYQNTFVYKAVAPPQVIEPPVKTRTDVVDRRVGNRLGTRTRIRVSRG